nr:DNA methyltransferase [Candidatus Sigynarchaeota archaeon]
MKKHYQTLRTCGHMNYLYLGENLRVLKERVENESVDLVYIDPPFNSDEIYTLSSGSGGTAPEIRIKVFDDTWHWDGAMEALHAELVAKQDKVAELIASFKIVLGRNNLLTYLVMMVPRLVELHRVLKPTGALYLHCDPTASHYLKLVLDAIFGIEHFQNEIVWCYTVGGKSKKRFAEKHDVILFFSKGKDYTFNGPAVAITRPRTHMKVEQDADGREYQVKVDKKSGKAYKYYIDEGKVPEDYWLIETLNRE